MLRVESLRLKVWEMQSLGFGGIVLEWMRKSPTLPHFLNKVCKCLINSRVGC